MQQDPAKDKDDFEDDLETFEDIPQEDKDLQRLKVDEEKSTGKELLEVDEKIEEKTD